MLPFLFLSSGLFLGWSLGANDAANVFGTAVGARMIRFKTAALICSAFVILGAVISGAGASHTLGTLGQIDAIAGSFTVAAAAALSVFWMSKSKLPVSTSQAIVGAIIGWNLFSGTPTDQKVLSKIVATWFISPVLAALFSMLFFLLFRMVFNRLKIHMLQMDLMTRAGLVLVGAFGAYSLGANNIANVMGVFVSVTPFNAWQVAGVTISGTQQLFFLGGLAIAAGVYTYSHKVMETVGRGLFHLTPEAALVVVLSNALVLFLFSSRALESWLIAHHLPPIPLVPVSSTQVVIGGIIGIGLIKDFRSIHYGILAEIAGGWLVTPIVAGVISFFSLFFLQNVFSLQVQ